jgi:hypothetical protein
VKRETRYLNTDLDLVAPQSLHSLANSLEAQGVFPLHVDLRDDQLWYATLETERQFAEPEPNVVALLTAIESLDPQSRSQWAACTTREFNIGYHCGDEPQACNHGLTPATLARMAVLEVYLRITLYPAARATSGTSDPAHDA